VDFIAFGVESGVQNYPNSERRECGIRQGDGTVRKK